jgi:hypothetical protein
MLFFLFAMAAYPGLRRFAQRPKIAMSQYQSLIQMAGSRYWLLDRGKFLGIYPLGESCGPRVLDPGSGLSGQVHCVSC